MPNPFWKVPKALNPMLCAALDRQHPRDLFDVHLLLRHEGITPPVLTAFLVYLISHARPIAALLDPPLRDLRAAFARDLRGMTARPISCEELIEARVEMIRRLREGLTAAHRSFLLSFQQSRPRWELLKVPHAKHMSAVQWRLREIAATRPGQNSRALTQLRELLGL
ncbi:MAG: nucleotidyl transferase AbiEii/AbiGii toxin family protein [Myxococcota bacterium]